MMPDILDCSSFHLENIAGRAVQAGQYRPGSTMRIPCIDFLFDLSGLTLNAPASIRWARVVRYSMRSGCDCVDAVCRGCFHPV